MFEERALINGKLNRHEYALGIYILVLGDHKRALEYCDKVYTTKGATNVRTHLLCMFLLVYSQGFEELCVHISVLTIW